ncbi:hypothetical protein CO666_07600 [Rhizobium chutanense]|uniref:Uncharacterized protein n=1 Tax=Rhizobium chutanense TaxID=2035448 RepID=A0A2A6JF51_9HYPH|nr:hypothetical protein CO666_07600 [Rhizobium chutanense]
MLPAIALYGFQATAIRRAIVSPAPAEERVVVALANADGTILAIDAFADADHLVCLDRSVFSTENNCFARGRAAENSAPAGIIAQSSYVIFLDTDAAAYILL